MTDPEADYDERLRRVLHAAADGVVPSGDGLERIRTRIARGPSPGGFRLLFGWLRSIAIHIRVHLPDLRPVLEATPEDVHQIRAAIRSALPAAPAAARSHLPGMTALLPRIGSALAAAITSLWRAAKRVPPAIIAMNAAAKSAVPRRLRAGDWLRPLLATAGAVVVASIMILAIPGLRQGVSQLASSVFQSSSPKPPPSNQGVAAVAPTTAAPVSPASTSQLTPLVTSTPPPSTTPTASPSPSCHAPGTSSSPASPTVTPRSTGSPCAKATAKPAHSATALSSHSATPAQSQSVSSSPSPSPSSSPSLSLSLSPSSLSPSPASTTHSGPARAVKTPGSRSSPVQTPSATPGA